MNLRPLSVLVVDEDCADREALQCQLRATGSDVRTATTGAEVIEACEFDPPDVLIMDLHLPDMDGFELCELIRHETRDCDPIIIITTEHTDELTPKYLGQMVEYAGGDYFLAKPCDGHVLMILLDEIADEVGGSAPGPPDRLSSGMNWPTKRSRREVMPR